MVLRLCRNWRLVRGRINQPRRRSCATSFGPPVRSRSSASACVRPSGAVRKERSSSSPSFPAASRTSEETWMLWSFAFAGIGDLSGGGGVPAGLTPDGPPFSADSSAARFVSGAVIAPLTAIQATSASLFQVLRRLGGAWTDSRELPEGSGLRARRQFSDGFRLTESIRPRGYENCAVPLKPGWVCAAGGPA